MKTERYTKLICLALAPMLLLSSCGKPAPEQAAAPEENGRTVPAFELSDTAVFKEETVYVNLAPDGRVTGVNVTDHLQTAMPQVRIEDVSDLEDIRDVKTFVDPLRENGRLYWDMEYTDLYYSGTTTRTPPIGVSVSYKLDGEDIPYSELKGKSGRVTVNISVKNTLTKTVTVSGTPYMISCPMLFLGGLILPQESFRNVGTDNAVVMSDGLHEIVFFVGVPGMGDSLGTKELGLPLLSSLSGTDYTLTAEVEDFSMGNMMLAAIPFSSLNALGPKGMSEGIDGVKGILSELENLIGAFSSLGLQEKIRLLYGNTDNMLELMNAVSDAAALYDDNRALLGLMDKYFTEENLALMQRTVEDIERVQDSGIGKLLNSRTFRQLTELLSALDAGLGSLSSLTGDAMKLMPILDDLNRALSDEEISASLKNIPQTTAKLRELMRVMEDSRGTLDALGSLFSEDSADELVSLLETASKLSELDGLDKAQSEHLAGRMREWLSFGEQYDIFTQRTDSAASSVMFIFKTAAI